MKEKYVEERFPRYFVFGSSVTELVDVCADSGLVAVVREEDAQTLIKQRDDVLDMLVSLAQALDEVDKEKFNSVWYAK